MIEGFLFDFDGVLVNSMPFHIEAWQEEFSNYGVTINPVDVYLREGSRADAIGRALVEKAGLNLSDEELAALIRRKRAIYHRITRAGLMPGARELLLELKRRGLKIGMVTGSIWENIRAVLDEETIALFDAVVTGRDVTHGKPHPEPYQKGALALGLAPAECVVVENAPFGIESAKRAGAFCVAVTSTLEASHLSEADLIFSDLNEIRTNLDGILKKAEAAQRTVPAELLQAK